MSISPIISVAEADTYNVLSADWLNTPEPNKEAHIYNASLYIHTTWTCSDIDWSDPLTIDDDVKRACAYYADADRLGVLFDPIEKTEAHRAMTMEKKKLGSMEKTIQWAQGGALTSGNPLQSIDAIMSLYCTGLSSMSLLRN